MKDAELEYVIDRIEGRWAVVECGGGESFTLPRHWLPPGAREGDVLRVTRTERLSTPDAASLLELRTDPEARRRREEAVRRLHDSLLRGPEGDITL